MRKGGAMTRVKKAKKVQHIYITGKQNYGMMVYSEWEYKLVQPLWKIPWKFLQNLNRTAI